MTLKRYTNLLTLLILTISVHAQNYGNIEFIENKGQWDKNVKFKGEVSGGAFFIRQTGFTILQHNLDDLENVYNTIHGRKPDGSLTATAAKKSLTLRSHSYNVDFLDASPNVEIVPDKAISSYDNYFIGNDPSKWATNCRIFQGITYKNVYPNVDVRYYTDKGFLKYDIIVRPGGDVSKIALRYTGVDKLEEKNKELNIKTSLGNFKELNPSSYQPGVSERKEVNCRYRVKNNIVRFDVEDYDPSATLTIDPVIIFCSFASPTSAGSWGFTATYGPDGSMYGGGIVFSNGFPVSPGAFQTSFVGGSGNIPVDIGIIKLSPDGSQRVYATYLGGTGDEQPHSLVVNGQGNLIIAGRTNSPVTGPGAYPTINNGSLANGNGNYDIVVTELNASGTGLIGSKRIGGGGDDGVNISPTRSPSSLQRNYGDDGRSEVIVDGSGNVCVASCTQSKDFPVTAGAFQPTFGGGLQDAVVLKFSPDLNSLLFASYLGGSANDAAYVLSVAPTGNIYVAGGTESTDLPGNTAGTIGPSNHGGIDGFVSIINSNGTAISRTSYFGTSGIDQIYGIQFDSNGFPYIMGQTTGAWFITPGTLTFGSSAGKQFIAKMQTDLSAYIYSTVFGTGSPTPNISPTAFLVDRCENVYVAGWGGFYEHPNDWGSAGTMGLPITADAIKSTTDGNDFYFFVLKRDAVSQLFGSYFGEVNTNPQVGGDHVDGGTSRFDKDGVIYEAVCANCKLTPPPYPVFPTTAGSYAPTNNATTGSGCNLAMLKLKLDLSGVHAGIRPSINGVPRDSSGCVPLTVDFADTIDNAQTFEWHFGDGSPVVTTTVPNTSHIYTTVGSYTVMLIGIDPTSCNVRDTSYVHIRVGNIQATLNFNPVKLNPCDSFKYEFDNTSTAPLVFGPQSFTWDFGDGSATVQAGSAPVFHNYSGPGTYNVKLVLTDTNYCNAPDSLTIQVRVAALVKAQFETPQVGCAPYTAVFNNTSLAGQTFQWDFGDGATSTATNPTHFYPVAGNYVVTLIANDPNTCNQTDTTRFTINVFDKPVSAFTFSPTTPVENTPTTFNNAASSDAVSFKWYFGDGDSLVTASRTPLQHQYNATGTFNACLVAYNIAGCTDTSCQQVPALIKILVDVPNAFTPQSGDINSVIMVKGFGITKMHFTIWNRWGQKVFETEDRFSGWNGKFKGTLQPMDVYAYTLDVEFFDGTKATKKGDITLIR